MALCLVMLKRTPPLTTGAAAAGIREGPRAHQYRGARPGVWAAAAQLGHQAAAALSDSARPSAKPLGKGELVSARELRPRCQVRRPAPRAAGPTQGNECMECIPTHPPRRTLHWPQTSTNKTAGGGGLSWVRRCPGCCSFAAEYPWLVLASARAHSYKFPARRQADGAWTGTRRRARQHHRRYFGGLLHAGGRHCGRAGQASRQSCRRSWRRRRSSRACGTSLRIPPWSTTRRSLCGHLRPMSTSDV